MSRASEYLLNSSDARQIDDIKGIWVASDTARVVDEVRKHASKYFPSVELHHIISVSNGVEGGPETIGVTTYSDKQVGALRVNYV